MGIKQIKNETGTYYLDDDGKLIYHEDLDWWSVHIPEGVVEIPNYALREFRELVLPALLKRVGKYAFLAGEVESAVFPSDSDPEMMVQLAHALRFAHTWDSEKLVKDWPREYADIYRGKGKPRESWKSWASIPFPARSSNPLPSQDSLLVLE